MELFGLRAPELLLIIFVLVLFFGKDKIPSMARDIGRSFNELKAGFKDGDKVGEEKADKKSK